MQNIPSHALDIRHMFRATPEYTESIKVEDKVVLLNCDSIPTTEGSKKVRDVSDGDIIVMQNNDTDVNCIVTSVVSESGKSTIMFKIQEGE